MARRIMQLMALFLVGLLVTVMALVFSISCDNQPKEISAELGEEVELKLGQTVFIEDEQIKFKFTEVIGDSRCPTGATCIWQGEVSCILEITYLESTYQKTITQPGLTEQFSEDTFRDYAISFNVTPYPELDEVIKADEYRLQLVID